MIKNQIKKNFFIGIDLGGKEKKTTGVCILEDKKIVLLKDVVGKEVVKEIEPYFKNTQVIAIDAPLTKGRGKGKMRLYEKFLSRGIFRQEKVNPLPPALMPELCNFAKELVNKLEKRKFILNINLIETFPTLVEKICRKNVLLKNGICKTENQRSALICGQVALFHFQFKTRYLGYKDGFLFLPEMSFWKKYWREKFYQAWKEKPYLKYYRLVTNLFK